MLCKTVRIINTKKSPILIRRVRINASEIGLEVVMSMEKKMLTMPVKNSTPIHPQTTGSNRFADLHQEFDTFQQVAGSV